MPPGDAGGGFLWLVPQAWCAAPLAGVERWVPGAFQSPRPPGLATGSFGPQTERDE